MARLMFRPDVPNCCRATQLVLARGAGCAVSRVWQVVFAPSASFFFTAVVMSCCVCQEPGDAAYATLKITTRCASHRKRDPSLVELHEPLFERLQALVVSRLEAPAPGRPRQRARGGPTVVICGWPAGCQPDSADGGRSVCQVFGWRCSKL